MVKLNKQKLLNNKPKNNFLIYLIILIKSVLKRILFDQHQS